MSRKRDIILVTGMSGAGKTTAMSIFEDMGYLVIDNLPPQLIDEFSDIWHDETQLPYNKVVMAVRMFDFPVFAKSAELSQLNPRMVFLNCSDDELLRRYKYNRRTHPMMLLKGASTIDEAIEKERDIYNNYEDFASITVDTTFTKKADLIDVFEEQLDFKFSLSTKIVFQSFGYRYGVPLDADYVFDVRFLDNPFYEADLRLKTGSDQEVYDYVLKDPKTLPFLDKLISLLDVVLVGNLNMDRGVVNVAIGCTGGQHRSVVVANYLKTYYDNNHEVFKKYIKDDQKLDIKTYHRDVLRNQHDVYDRHFNKVEKIDD